MTDRLMKFWRDWRGLLVFFAVMILFRSAVADWNQVPSGSMKPGILAGDRIVVDKLAWDLRVPFTTVRVAGWSHPSRGDVVTFDNPVDGRLFIKRVVAVPGDRV
ncbi:MAG: signal peptidase I, partial [Gammaproteobacteria bacterium]|nr:signal peptidase I [Gammaproteobacteria bacterium]